MKVLCSSSSSIQNNNSNSSSTISYSSETEIHNDYDSDLEKNEASDDDREDFAILPANPIDKLRNLF